MAPKRTTRANPATTTTTTTTFVADAQLEALIEQGIARALVARNADRNTNGDDSHNLTTTPEAAHATPWRTLKKMMTDKYYPREEIKKLDFEIWNVKVKGTDVVAYSQRFQELAL
nr:reverse transcriptase domain-containing protein [Tanacetum cinerariifolium]